MGNVLGIFRKDSTGAHRVRRDRATIRLQIVLLERVRGLLCGFRRRFFVASKVYHYMRGKLCESVKI
jgi:hypothetical protein